MSSFRQTISRIRNLVLVALLVTWQVAAPLGSIIKPATASAAIVGSSVASTGFVLGGSYSSVAGQPTGSGKFKNGNVGAYPEGACIPAVFQVTNTSGVTGDLLVTPVIDYSRVGTKDVGFTDLEAVTTGLTDATSATNLNQLTYTGSPLSSATSFKTTTGTSVTASVSGVYAGNDTSTTAPSSSDSFRHYNVTLTNVPAGATVNVLTCGRLGLDASEYNGSSLSIRTVQGGQENVPIPVNQILVLPNITITKTVTQGSALPSDFSFNVSPAINGVSSYSIPVGQTSVTIPNVNPDGSYTITESGPSGYRFTGGTGTSCAVTASTINTAAGQMVASVAAGKPATDATCNFSNTVNTGSITIIKDALPNDTQDFNFTTTGGLTPSSFVLDDDAGVVGADATHSNTQTFSGVLPGSYSVSEAATNGWDLTGLDCGGAAGVTTNGATASINLAAGQNVTCTYSNTKKSHLIVEKTTLPAGDPTSFSINASSSTGGVVTGGGAGTITDATDQNYEVTPGTYSVSETATPGWTKTGDTCQNVVVAAGATVHCTLTNTKLAKLKIVKDAQPNGPQDFSFATTGSGLSSFMLDDDSDNTLPNNQQFINLNPGSYSVTEASVTGWDLTGLTCTGTNGASRSGSTLNLTLAAGEDVTCTFVNTQRGTINGIKSEVNADGSFVSNVGGVTINLVQNGQVVGSTVTAGDGSFSFSNLINGTYSLFEALQSGWTQIFGPNDVVLSAGQTSTGNNFGNFRNGTINGFKFNDLNGNGAQDPGEPKLSGWTITLYGKGQTNLLDHVLGSQQTDGSGNYSFGNLAPGSYQVCETMQTGWTQTLPGNNGCYVFVIDQSGETNQGIFGNQGRGTISVVKNVDTNADGTVDQTDVTTWNWNINGSGNFATGSANHQAVAAGTYTVSEQQKANYHVTASSCTGETTPNNPTTSLSATVSPGENVVCTYTNTRDSGSFALYKHVNNTHGGTAVASDFNLHIKQNGVDVAGSPAVGSENGTGYSLLTGTYTVSEDALPTGYTQTSIVCDGQTTNQITITNGGNQSCIITNSDLAPHLTVIKHVINDNSGTASASDFTMNVTATNVSPSASFPGSEAGTTVTLNAGSYSVAEGSHTGYTTTLSADCSGTIALNQSKTCTITNNDIPHPGIHIVKSGPATAHEGDTVTYTFTVTNTGDTTLSSTAVNDNIAGAGTYQSGDANNNGLLDRTETWIYTKNYTILAGQVANVVNTATVCATDPAQTQVCDSDNHTLDVLHPAISVTKDGPIYGYEGQVIGYTFVVTNTGDTALSNVGIDDDIAVGELCNATTLAVGASTNCTAHYLIPTPQINNVVNNVIASGTDSLGRTVTGHADHTLDVLHPAIHVVKSGPATAHAGDTVTYSFTVTNSGDIALSSLTVRDNIAGAGTYVSGDTNNNGKLDLTETWVYTKNYTIPANQDADVINTVEVCGLDPIQATADNPVTTCDTDQHTLDVLHPAIHVVKSGPANAYQGDTVTYTFSVTNIGDTPLSGLTVNDNVTGTGTYVSGDTNNNGSLDLTETWVYTADYTVPTPQATDVTNTVTACGSDSLQENTCDTDQHTLHVYHPTITINKVLVVNQQVENNYHFNLQIDGATAGTGADVPNDDGLTTGDVVVTPGTHSVGETAGTDTDLSHFVATQDEGCGNGSVTVTKDEHVTCTITNTERGSITIVKDATPDSTQAFTFTGNLTGDDEPNFQLTDDGTNSGSETRTFSDLAPGSYDVTEPAVQGWDLDSITCTDENGVNINERSVNFKLSAGQNVTCTFNNVQRGTVTVTKYEDLNRNGQFDPATDLPEPALANWDITLDDTVQTTGTNGTTSFTNIKRGAHTLDEIMQDGWNQGTIQCDNQNTDERLISEEQSGYVFSVAPGANINCTIGNYRDDTLLINKSVDRPAPLTNLAGDTVTYTLDVAAPTDSGPSFDGVVTDLPPDNIAYEPGSWTAVLTKADGTTVDLKADGTTTEPTYGSPGKWNIGRLLAGEHVTLSYRALIKSIVSPGTYPDLAFAQGFNTPDPATRQVVTAGCVNGCVNATGTPFVSTAVAVISPESTTAFAVPTNTVGQVLGASILVNTGQPLLWLQFIVPSFLLVATGLLWKQYGNKGASR